MAKGKGLCNLNCLNVSFGCEEWPLSFGLKPNSGQRRGAPRRCIAAQGSCHEPCPVAGHSGVHRQGEVAGIWEWLAQNVKVRNEIVIPPKSALR